MSINFKNYNQISTEAARVEHATEVTEEEVVVSATDAFEEDVTPTTCKSGVVCKCAKLNVRAAADVNAKVVCIINAGTAVNIYDEVDGFYKIDDGYCMKKYISVKE